MVRLPQPSRDVATRVLGEVSFEERLTGIKMRAMAGNQSLPIYSFEEAVNFLHMDSLDDLLRLGSKSYVGYMDLHALKRWISDIIGDKDLATAIGRQIEKQDNYRDRIKPIKNLMKDRLSQCKELLQV